MLETVIHMSMKGSPSSHEIVSAAKICQVALRQIPPCVTTINCIYYHEVVGFDRILSGSMQIHAWACPSLPVTHGHNRGLEFLGIHCGASWGHMSHPTRSQTCSKGSNNTRQVPNGQIVIQIHSRPGRSNLENSAQTYSNMLKLNLWLSAWNPNWFKQLRLWLCPWSEWSAVVLAQAGEIIWRESARLKHFAQCLTWQELVKFHPNLRETMKDNNSCDQGMKGFQKKNIG